ncbi:hypothetical protein V8D89_003561 [Ganoderma adspersum]
MSRDPPITHDSPVLPSHIAFDTSRLVGSPEELRKLIVQETQRRLQVIDESTDVITKLRTFHNGLAPVNALPAELLGLIFAQLVFHGDLLPKSPCEHFSPPQVDPPTGSSDIVAVASVCRYWRTVTIQNPWLWTSFAIHDRAGVEEFLARSKDLLISLTLTRRFLSNVAPVLAPSAHRIRSLYISTGLEDDIDLLWAELSCPAPNLRELFIEHLPRNSFVTGDAIGQAAHLSAMFNGKVPVLRVLTLRGVPSPFTVMPPSLIHLDIGTSQGILPSFRGLLHMLSNCPLLKTLNLRGSWDWNEFVNHTIARNNVALPKLDAINLFLEPQDAPGILLSSLALPVHTNVLISSVMEDGSEFVHILDTVVPQLAPPCFSGFRRLQLFRGGHWGLQAYRAPDAFLGPPALDIHCIDPWGNPQAQWAGFLLDWPFDTSHIETLVLSHKPTTQLSIDGGEPVELDRTFDRWGETFRQLPALKTLRAMGIPATELELVLDVLRERPSDPTDALCPDLSSLEIFDVQVSDTAADRLLHVALSYTPDETKTSTLGRVELFNSKPSDVGFLMCRRVISLGVEVVIDGEII